MVATSLEQPPSGARSIFDSTHLIVYFAAIPIVLTIMLATTFHFIYRRHHPIIYNRDVPLTLLNVMANLVVSVLHLTKTINYYDYPCFIMLWVPALIYPLYILTIFARLTRLIFMYRLSEARLQAIDLRTLPMKDYNGLNATAAETCGQDRAITVNSWGLPRDDTSQQAAPIRHHVILATSEDSDDRPKMNSFDNIPSHCHWSLAYRRRFTTRALSLAIFALLLAHVVLTLAMQLRYPSEFTWIPPKLGRCGHSAAYLPLWISCGLYIILIAPIIVYHSRGIHDAYGIRWEYYCGIGIALFFFGLYFLSKWLGFDDNDTFPAAMWLVIGTLVGHLWMVARPAWLTERYLRGNKRHRSDSLERIQGIAEFKMLLSDPIWRREFRLFSVRDFSVENILFYEEVMRLPIGRIAEHPPPAHGRREHEALEAIPETSIDDIEPMPMPVAASSLPNSEFTESSSAFSPGLAHARSFSRSSQVSEPQTLEGYAEDEALTSCNNSSGNSNSNSATRNPLARLHRASEPAMDPISVVARYMNEHPAQHQQQSMHDAHGTAHLDRDNISITGTLPDELVHGLWEVYKLFIAPDAEYELNLSHQVREDLLEQFRQNELTADMLHPAVSEILMLMYLNTYPRFVEWMEQQGPRKYGPRRSYTKRWSLTTPMFGHRACAPLNGNANELRSGPALRMAKDNGW
ncbi:hypothetical protein SYNPS1DRAFT_28795 [Syncephalis pseudoplumigaleata]|uniref:RGS domain-containing protein n=1 Tax=Syncephalis pseudoplumigaleata TaxID=1712513 RepID=A0A4P9YZA6_9FUNG|nr:hypothetical protein SYNPS1DRAFT_28795 [Syncephalis pseudoplumigaleata]|eukprot:RKP25477.1 hypothetical protein SYNPS1DRAFT_28795 [Syncephalis pseudoplumigaleata]